MLRVTVRGGYGYLTLFFLEMESESHVQGGKKRPRDDTDEPGSNYKHFKSAKGMIKGKKKGASKKQVLNVVMGAAEKKYYSLAVDAVAVDSAGTVTDLTPIPQGVTVNSRVGDSLYMTSLEFNYQTVGALGTDNNRVSYIRVILFQWYPSSTPSASNILLTTGVNSIIAPYNHDKRFEFKILYDKTHTMFNTVNLGTGWSNLDGAVCPKVKTMVIGGFRHKVNFSPGLTSGVNKLYCLVLSNGASGNLPNWSAVSKLNFKDA